MNTARNVGRKRARRDDYDPATAPTQAEIADEMERLAKRRRLQCMRRPDQMRFGDDTPVTCEDALRSLARKRGVSAGPLATSAATAGGASDDTTAASEPAESVDLNELADAQRRARRRETVQLAVREMVQSLLEFETLNAITTNWLVESMPHGHSCMRHLADLLRYIITEPVRLRLFYTAGERRDELHMFGRHPQFHMPFSLLSDRAKILLAFMMSKQALFFEKIERHTRGLCGRVYSEFVFDDALDQAVVECAFRERLLRHTLLSVLRHANEQHNVAAAVGTIISMACEIVARDVSMQRMGSIVRSARERRTRDSVAQVMHSLFGMLLNAQTLAVDLCDFTKRVAVCSARDFTPRIGSAPIRRPGDRRQSPTARARLGATHDSGATRRDMMATTTTDSDDDDEDGLLVDAMVGSE
jgi:hypothetical protein